MLQRSISKSGRAMLKKFYLYIFFLFLLSLSVAIMPCVSYISESMRLWSVINGILFWSGVGGVIFFALNINKSRCIDKNYNKKYAEKITPGIILFFQNEHAKIADIIMFISIIGIVITVVFTKNNIIIFIMISAFIFSFGMHCMLNGINYIYINYKIRRVGENE